MLYMGREVRQNCILVQWEVSGKGNACEVYNENIVRERGGSKGTVMWGSDNVPCRMNALTSGTTLTVSVTYVLECTQCTYLNKSMLVK